MVEFFMVDTRSFYTLATDQLAQVANLCLGFIMCNRIWRVGVQASRIYNISLAYGLWMVTSTGYPMSCYYPIWYTWWGELQYPSPNFVHKQYFFHYIYVCVFVPTLPSRPRWWLKYNFIRVLFVCIFQHLHGNVSILFVKDLLFYHFFMVKLSHRSG